MAAAMETSDVRKPARRGPRRSGKAQAAAVAATTALLVEVGYHRLTIEGIAARAGIGKATIYRWWPSKAALVLDALIESLGEISTTSTESVRDDLYLRLDFSERPEHQVLDGIATVALLADLWHSSPDLLDKWRRDYLASQRRSLSRDLQRAVAAGLVPADADLELIMDTWAGTLIFRSLLSGAAADPAVGRRLVDATLAAAPRLET